MNSALTLLDAMPWYAWVAIVGIICGCTTGSISLWTEHRERMAMIERGMDPERKATPLSNHGPEKVVRPEL